MQITIKEGQGFWTHIVQLIIAISIGCGLLLASENKAVPEGLGVVLYILGFIILIGCYMWPTWTAADYSNKIPEIKKLKEENKNYKYLRIPHPKYYWILFPNIMFSWLVLPWIIIFTMATEKSLVVNVPDNVVKDSGLGEKQMGDGNPSSTPNQQSNIEKYDETADIDDKYYEMVSGELDSDQINTALWTKAFSLCDGDETRTKAKYIGLRVQQMKAEQDRLLAAEQEEKQQAEKDEKIRKEPEAASRFNKNIGIVILVIFFAIYLAAISLTLSQW